MKAAPVSDGGDDDDDDEDAAAAASDDADDDDEDASAELAVAAAPGDSVAVSEAEAEEPPAAAPGGLGGDGCAASKASSIASRISELNSVTSCCAVRSEAACVCVCETRERAYWRMAREIQQVGPN